MIMTNDFVKVFFMKYYSEQQTAKKRRCVTRIRTVLVLLCLSALAACLYLMLHVTTGNAARSFWFCLILFALSGWIVITLREVLLLPLKRVIAHEEGILKNAEVPAQYSGTLTRTGLWFTLPSSITLMKLTLTSEDGESVNLSVERSRMKLLPADGTRVKLSAVRGFVTEVRHEK